ncbi:MAG TPA: hypothetical protein VMV47_17750 [Bacteroidales bacterium]|nr:hypothetical protein [Bacteroidales bacterium]
MEGIPGNVVVRGDHRVVLAQRCNALSAVAEKRRLGTKVEAFLLPSLPLIICLVADDHHLKGVIFEQELSPLQRVDREAGRGLIGVRKNIINRKARQTDGLFLFGRSFGYIGSPPGRGWGRV